MRTTYTAVTVLWITFAALVAIATLCRADEQGQQYTAIVERVLDGDTVRLRVELADFDVVFLKTARVYGINSHEIHSSDDKEKQLGLEDKAFAETLLPTGGQVKIRAHRATAPNEKYGRWLTEITLPDGRDYAKAMVKAGHAVEYFGGKR